jgi:NAD(P)-dependent dehydrogenase (short-subunit alcohol dehydrogenase family)
LDDFSRKRIPEGNTTDEDEKEGRPSKQNVRPVRPAFSVAQEVGAGLDECEVLFRTLPPCRSVFHATSNPGSNLGYCHWQRQETTLEEPENMMNSLPERFHALVIGASGAIGTAFTELLGASPRCASITGLHRHSEPSIDFSNEDSIAAAAGRLAVGPRFHLVINAAGLLHSENFMPEKRLADLSYAQMQATFAANTYGPALVLRHFTRLMDTERSVMAMLSAKVGSIGDNRLGGWYSYRASKAALNMLVKTAAIEVARTQPNSVIVALHPGTVSSRLSRPFRGAEIGRAPQDAATDMLRVLDSLVPSDTGSFRSYDGSELPW